MAAAGATLTVMVEDDAAPWSLADGTGFANAVVVAAFAAAGVKASLDVVPYARCKNAVLQGRCAACFSMSADPAFAGVVAFSAQPLFTCSADYYADGLRPVTATAAADLPRGTVVGTVLGYEYPPSVGALRRRGILVFDEVPSEDMNLRKLAAGRVDLALLNTNAIKSPQALLVKAGAVGKVRKVFGAGLLKSYIGFSLAHPLGPWAKARFDRGYRRIAANGRLKAIQAQWKRVAP
jgi:ABC-type amino acid transport substrate-binding protein